MSSAVMAPAKRSASSTDAGKQLRLADGHGSLGRNQLAVGVAMPDAAAAAAGQL
jgi:hypothetical protein